METPKPTDKPQPQPQPAAQISAYLVAAPPPPIETNARQASIYYTYAEAYPATRRRY
jgi:hypothetical protein